MRGIIVIAAAALAAAAAALAGCETTQGPVDPPAVRVSPIQFTSWQRVPPSHEVEFAIAPGFTPEDITQVWVYDRHYPERRIWLHSFVKTTAEGKRLVVRMPPWSSFLGVMQPELRIGDTVLDVDLAVQYTQAGLLREVSWPIEVKDLRWAVIIAPTAILLTLLAAGLAGRSLRKKRGPDGKVMKGRGLPILDLIRGPTGTYSLSRAQLLIWTLVTIFGLAYVWNMTERFLELTPQMLMFLGIASGTTVATRLAASPRISVLPPRVREIVAQRRPRLADLIGVDNRPSVVKLQMLVFTIITAVIVFKEIATKFSFPELSEGLVALMGISSATYVSSELASRVDADKVEAQAKLAEAAIADRVMTFEEAVKLPDVEELVHLLDTQLP